MAQSRPSIGRLVITDFRWLFGVIVLSRMAVVPWRVFLLVRWGGPTDMPYFLQLARMSDQGLYPYIHFWAEYPPVYPGFVIGAYRLSAWLASGPVRDALFYTLLMLFVIACELGTIILLHKLALLLGSRETAQRSVLIYAVCFVPAYLFAGWFDHLPTLLFLAALYLMLVGRERSSAAMAGLGIVSKMFPIMILPLAVCTVRGLRRKMAYLAVAGAVVALFILPFMAVNPAAVLASIRTAFFRPSWETVYALLDRYYGYGVVAPLSQHLDLASAGWANHTSKLPWRWSTLVFGILFALFYLRFYGVRDRRRIVAAAAFTLTFLLLYSKGYSPQYLTWIAPLLILLYPNRRGALYLVLLGLFNLVELPGYFSFFPDQRIVLVIPVLARTALLLVLAFDCLAIALSQRSYIPFPGISPASESRWQAYPKSK